MNRLNTLILIALSHNLISCAGLVSSSYDWAGIQSVGGIKLGEPYARQSSFTNNWYLPISVNVSGTEKITVEPTAMNSGNECSFVSADVKPNSIYIQVNTTVIGFVSNSASCPDAELGKIAEGYYKVYYGDTGDTSHEVGIVKIEL